MSRSEIRQELVVIIGLAWGMANVPQAMAWAQMPCEQSVLTFPMSGDGSFGQSVELDGNRLVVGAHSIFQSPGLVFVYDRSIAGWELSSTLKAPDWKLYDDFGWAVAIDGDSLIVARPTDGSLNSKGSVYAYQRQSNGTWLMTQKIANTKPGIWAFGWAMSIDGSRVAIGAKGAAALSPRGRVYIFELENGLWVEKAEVAPSLDDIGDWFGASVALQGDRLAVGAPQNGTGRAYVFDRQANGAWVEQALFTPPVVSPTGDEFGRSVAVDGDTVVVGSIGYDAPILNVGAAFIYRLNAGTWSLEQQVSPPFNGDFAYFGYAVDIDGDSLLVGAPNENGPFLGTGLIYRYLRNNSSWTPAGTLNGSKPFELTWFGARFARSGNELAVSAPAGFTPGIGRVYLLSSTPSTLLGSSKTQVATGSGGTQPLQLAACSGHAGDFYLLLGSLSGTAPVLPLGPLDLPLVFDAYTQFTLTSPNSLILPASFGQLDAWGRADTSFRLPPGSAPSFVGQTAHHAFVVLDQTTLALENVSNPAPVLLAP
jgi:hypothetical protein